MPLSGTPAGEATNGLVVAMQALVVAMQANEGWGEQKVERAY